MSTPARPQQEGDDWFVRFLLSSPGRRVEPAEEQQPLVPLTRTNEELPRVEPAEERPLVPLTRSRSRSCSPDNKRQRRARKKVRTRSFPSQMCDEHDQAVKQVQLQLDDDSDVPQLISSSEPETDGGKEHTRTGGRTRCRPSNVTRSRSRSPPPGTGPVITRVEPAEACPPVPLTCVGNQFRCSRAQTTSHHVGCCECGDEFGSHSGCCGPSLGPWTSDKQPRIERIDSGTAQSTCSTVPITHADDQYRCSMVQTASRDDGCCECGDEFGSLSGYCEPSLGHNEATQRQEESEVDSECLNQQVSGNQSMSRPDSVTHTRPQTASRRGPDAVSNHGDGRRVGTHLVERRLFARRGHATCSRRRH